MHVFPNHIPKMASSSSSSSLLLIIPSTILLFFFFISGLHSADGSNCYESIISFGDSIADTGNLLLLNGGGSVGPGKFPYGETYFHRSTGRFSDGRLIIDFIAEAVGLPLVPPYAGGEQNDSSFKSGVNFAVGGATALDSDFFRKKGIMVSNNYSLDVQMGWFKKLLPSLCSSDSGFGNEVLKACCGGGGPYNANPGMLCGDAGAQLCDDPSKYVCWDGVHLTEAAYRTITNNLLTGPLAMPILNDTCSKIAATIDSKQIPSV